MNNASFRDYKLVLPDFLCLENHLLSDLSYLFFLLPLYLFKPFHLSPMQLLLFFLLLFIKLFPLLNAKQ
jgi:hypothetical protein